MIANSYNWYSSVTPTAKVKAVKMEHNVMREGKKGMIFHIDADIGRAKGKTAYITVFLEDKDGKNLDTAVKQYATTEGNLRVRQKVIPLENYSTYRDLTIFLPHSLLPASPEKTTYRFRCVKWLLSKNPYRGSFLFSKKG